MSRDHSSELIAAQQSGLVREVVFVRLALAGGDLLLHTALGNVTFEGYTFIGAGALGSISGGKEDADGARNPWTLSLTGIQSADIDMPSVMDESNYKWRVCEIWVALMDERMRPISGSGATYHHGYMSHLSFSVGQTTEFVLHVEPEQPDSMVPAALTYSDADQQALFSGDVLFEGASNAEEYETRWMT